MKKFADSVSLRLSAMRALWGLVTPNVRKVSIEEKNNLISLYFYFDKQPSEDEDELAEEAATEVIADFPEPYMINCKKQVVNYPTRIDEAGYLVYMRHELTPDACLPTADL